MEPKKIKLGVIDFVNCLPILYVIENFYSEYFDIIKGPPAFINKLLNRGLVDLAPISSIEYIQNKENLILIKSSLISCYKECASVVLFSKYKLDSLDCKKIGVPSDSATSVAILKILLREQGITNNLFELHSYEKNVESFLVNDFDAVLFIGDNALNEQIKEHPGLYKYDLGSLWLEMTKTPPVFGTWCASKKWAENNIENLKLADSIIKQAVEKSLELYLNEIVELAENKTNIDKIIIKNYLTEKINYRFEPKHFDSIQKLEYLYNKHIREEGS